MSKANQKYAKYEGDPTPVGKDPACARQTPRPNVPSRIRRLRTNKDKTCLTK